MELYPTSSIWKHPEILMVFQYFNIYFIEIDYNPFSVKILI